MSTTTNLTYLQRNMLDDSSAGIWSTAELYDAMELETDCYSGILARVGATASYFESGRSFWVQEGTAVGQGPECQILLNGTILATAAYTLDYLNGRVLLATASTTTDDDVTATFYACNLWQVAANSLMKRLNSTSFRSGETSIRLGPLAKTTKNVGLIKDYENRVSAFQRFAARWRAEATMARRVRM